MTVPPVFTTFRIWVGSTITEPFAVLDSNSAPVDLTGYKGKLTATRDDEPVFTSVIDATTENGGLTIDGPNGTVTYNMPSDASAALTVAADGEAWPFKLLLIQPGTPDIVDRIVQGYVIALP